MGSCRDQNNKSQGDDTDLVLVEARLAQIADLIGVPVEVFTAGVQEPSDLTGARELLQIWAELKSRERREQLLTFARELLKT